MAFGMFRMMFNAGGNAVPVLEQMTNASRDLVNVSSSLAPTLNQVGGSVNNLVSAASRLSEFESFENALQAVNSQAAFLQPVLLDAAKSVKTLGTNVTGLTEQMAQLTQEQASILGISANLSAQNKATAKAFFDVAESVRSVGATGQVTSTRLASLSQTLQLFAQNTGRQASVELQQLSNRFVQASAQMKSAENVARELKNANLSLSDAQRLAHAETVKISDALTKFSVIGGASSSVILRMANQLNTLSASVHPQFTNSLKAASTELITLSSQLKITEQAAAKAGAPQGGFQMMKDVSEGAANRMRMISSASQGAMISMALLQRNVTGLAFSLIFLQFSGFLKLSLAVAGALALVGGLGLGFRALVREGTRLNELNDKFFILSDSLQTSGLAMDAARVLAEKYGTTIGPLADVQLAGLLAKAGLTNKEFDTFAMLLKLTNLGLVNGVDNSEQLASKFLSMKQEGKGLDEILKELGFSSLPELQRRLDNLNQTSLGDLSNENARVKREFAELFGGSFSQVIATWWNNWTIEWMKSFIAFKQLFSDDWLTGLTSLFHLLTLDVFKDLEGPNKAFFASWWKAVQEDVWVASSTKLLSLIWNFVTVQFPKPFVWAFNTLIVSHFNMWKDIFSDLTKWENDIIGNIVDFTGGIWSTVWGNVVRGTEVILGGLWQIGRDAVIGLWDGFMSFPIVQKAVSLAQNLISSFRRALDQNSPSKEFMKIGKSAMEGLYIGMGASSRSHNNSNINVTINVKGSFSNDPQLAARSTAGQVLDGMRRSGSFSGAGLVV